MPTTADTEAVLTVRNMDDGQRHHVAVAAHWLSSANLRKRPMVCGKYLDNVQRRLGLNITVCAWSHV